MIGCPNDLFEKKWDGRTVPESLLFFSGLDISPPFLYQLLHIVRDFRVERQAFTCGGMFEPQGFRMQCLSGTNFEAVVDKLFVPGKGGTCLLYTSHSPGKETLDEG